MGKIIAIGKTILISFLFLVFVWGGVCGIFWLDSNITKIVTNQNQIILLLSPKYPEFQLPCKNIKPKGKQEKDKDQWDKYINFRHQNNRNTND